MTAVGGVDANQSYARDLVRSADTDRYVATLYAPSVRRGDLFALYAFDAEISRIHKKTTEPLPGEIRLQWWRDVVAGTRSEEAQAHPTAAALSDMITRLDLPRRALDDVIEARIFDLYDDPMSGRNDLEGYLGQTRSSIFQVAAVILDPGAAREAADASGHAGVAIGLVEVLRSLSTDFVRFQKFVPGDVLQAAGLERRTFAGRSDPVAELRAIQMMQAMAKEHLERFEAAIRRVSRDVAPAYLPLAPMAAGIRRMKAERKGFPEISPVRRQLSIFWRAMRGW